MRTEDLRDALWDLVWAGLVTNDTFAPLRGTGRVRGRNPRQRADAIARSAGGRWSLVRGLRLSEIAPTERAYAKAVKLLERHGIVSREAATVEAIPGGFAAISPVLRSMEESGQVRRGYFVEGLGGAQYAFPGAVDRLRAVRADPEEPVAVVLAATDPANPYGQVLPWPERERDNGARPQRRAGAVVVLVAGDPVIYVSKSRKQLMTFPAADDGAKLDVALAALPEMLLSRRRRSMQIDTVDGMTADRAPIADAMRRVGFVAGYRGLELELR